ncbi:D-serine ammonia-lyase [Domibacillus sp. PGB-M46]|uniref:D-serine ammonia-lyase n=1 Tax=Domibacillus sp. PGB-M46 TaxID=2910255 RepID=UPI001F582278|nr:D-serine ammonia-lyase [Domibacillus sp. PGB-M46]MCI2254115.1 D-serine ammonia-lyase [Domibacillus sp. PGB-M46]
MKKDKQMSFSEPAVAVIESLQQRQNVLWVNRNRHNRVPPLFSLQDVEEAEKRLQRFAPYLEVLFPELEKEKGFIESPVVPIPEMKAWLEEAADRQIDGGLWLKEDHKLPISGSIKARGGIYEVLTYAEELALKEDLIREEDDYRAFNGPAFKTLFSSYRIIVGSTGNLGLSIGIMGARMGFQVTVHMSADAKKWKKELLRQKGALVVEHKADYEKAVAEGRDEAAQDSRAYFIDDEHSHRLFLGYAVAGLRLKRQFDEKGILVNEQQPLYVYLPCGIGGGPGGVAFGLHLAFGPHVHCFFAEPAESACMLLGLATGLHDRISVQDIGLTNQTEADGLAVGRPSGFVGKLVEPFIAGGCTVHDDQLFAMLNRLAETEQIKLEPSALAGMIGPVLLAGEKKIGGQPIHLVWATGGSMVPGENMDAYIQKGRTVPADCLNIKK